MLNLISSLVAPVSGLLDKFIEDKDQRAMLAHEIATLAERQAQEQIVGQIKTNQIEAAHQSMFVAGWRPAVGWVCALAMLLNFILIPFINLGMEFAGLDIRLDLIEMDTMMPVLLGMLGLGGMRSYEKARNVAREK
jgi:CheY-like chemotaxis protein|tara:strand:+ start:2289 stop:2696 length:408 start_codon:yes stop_codon:yes gene_type:complete